MLRELIKVLYNNIDLIIMMTRRELVDRYAGQIIGGAWSILHPLISAFIYILVFQYIFKSRVDLPNVPNNYPSYLMSGLFCWLAVIDALSRSSQIFLANAELVKQIVFPKEVLIFRCAFAALFSQIIATIVDVVYTTIYIKSLPATIFLLPFVLLLQSLFLLGLCFFIGTIGAFVRDIKDIIQAIGSFGIYFAPIFYLPGLLPRTIEYVMILNPFTCMVFVFQDVLFYGQILHPISWLTFMIMAISSAILGRKMYKKFEHSFANVL